MIVCPKGHMVETTDDRPTTREWFAKFITCDYCLDLLTQKKPFKAKRTGES